MRRLFTLLLPLHAFLSGLIVASIFVGHQQPLSTWAQILHLSDCELPCWIGIVPGQTTLAEAQRQIERVYGSKFEYQLEQKSDFEFKVTYVATRESFLIAFLPGSIITQMHLLPYPESLTSKKRPTIPDLYDSLGSPVSVNIVAGQLGNKVNLIYKDQRIQVYVSDFTCHKILLTQEIDGLTIYAGLPTYGYGWLADSKQWRGFGRCYDFERKSSP